MKWFEWLAIVTILLFIFGYTANALVGAFTEAHDKLLPKKYHYPAVIITTAILIGLMTLLSRSCQCSNEELTAPNGQTTIEHYEPRY